MCSGLIPLNEKHPDDLDPSYLGDSVGRWEGDTLVVDVTGFKERLVGSKISTDALHIVERFTRVDYNTINYEAQGGGSKGADQALHHHQQIHVAPGHTFAGIRVRKQSGSGPFRAARQERPGHEVMPTDRREFLTATAAGLAGASLAQAPLAGLRSATPADTQDLIGNDGKRRILLRGGVVLSLDPRVGDFEKADVLIDGKMIATIAPSISAADAEVVDCSGTIVMPGFITTHHHQYETLQRSIIADGLLAGAWPQESYGSVVQNIWTAGRIADPANPDNVIWDLGRVPYDPEDCYISELVACLSEISEGITTGTDTSQANHTPEHTDAMIKGLMDSGRRMVFDYSGGTNRSAEGIPFEFPGAMNDTTKGIGRHREDVLQLDAISW